MRLFIHIETEEDAINLRSLFTEIGVDKYSGTSFLTGGYYSLDNETGILTNMGLEETEEEKYHEQALKNGWYMSPTEDFDRLVKMYKNEILTRFNSGKPQWGLMDHNAMVPMIDVLEFGAQKYAAENWRKPMEDPIQAWESLMRHVMEIKDGIKGFGDPYDKDSNLNHIGHAMCNLMFLSHHLIVKGEQQRKRPE